MDKHDKLMMKLIFWCFIALLCATFMVTPVFASGQMSGATGDRLITAIIEVESGNNDSPEPGDKNKKDWAYGCMQIRQDCVTDVNQRFGTNYTSKDCHGNRELSVWIFRKYMEIYATEARLGRKPTDEDRARIWNGGPNGYKRSDTKSYWAKVQKALKKL
ncbi:MAG: hypothetical protein U0522_01690 [Candidatus Paceibacterota bacterium]